MSFTPRPLRGLTFRGAAGTLGVGTGSLRAPKKPTCDELANPQKGLAHALGKSLVTLQNAFAAGRPRRRARWR